MNCGSERGEANGTGEEKKRGGEGGVKGERLIVVNSFPDS